MNKVLSTKERQSRDEQARNTMRAELQQRLCNYYHLNNYAGSGESGLGQFTMIDKAVADISVFGVFRCVHLKPRAEAELTFEKVLYDHNSRFALLDWVNDIGCKLKLWDGSTRNSFTYSKDCWLGSKDGSRAAYMEGVNEDGSADSIIKPYVGKFIYSPHEYANSCVMAMERRGKAAARMQTQGFLQIPEYDSAEFQPLGFLGIPYFSYAEDQVDLFIRTLYVRDAKDDDERKHRISEPITEAHTRQLIEKYFEDDEDRAKVVKVYDDLLNMLKAMTATWEFYRTERWDTIKDKDPDVIKHVLNNYFAVYRYNKIFRKSAGKTASQNGYFGAQNVLKNVCKELGIPDEWRCFVDGKTYKPKEIKTHNESATFLAATANHKGFGEPVSFLQLDMSFGDNPKVISGDLNETQRDNTVGFYFGDKSITIEGCELDEDEISLLHILSKNLYEQSEHDTKKDNFMRGYSAEAPHENIKYSTDVYGNKYMRPVVKKTFYQLAKEKYMVETPSSAQLEQLRVTINKMLTKLRGLRFKLGTVTNGDKIESYSVTFIEPLLHMAIDERVTTKLTGETSIHRQAWFYLSPILISGMERVNAHVPDDINKRISDASGGKKSKADALLVNLLMAVIAQGGAQSFKEETLLKKICPNEIREGRRKRAKDKLNKAIATVDKMGLATCKYYPEGTKDGKNYVFVINKNWVKPTT